MEIFSLAFYIYKLASYFIKNFFFLYYIFSEEYLNFKGSLTLSKGLLIMAVLYKLYYLV